MIEYGLDINLEGLRYQLTSRLALALMGVGIALVLLVWPVVSPSFVIAVPAAVLFVALGGGVWTLAHVCPVLARCLLIGALTAGLLAAMGLSAAPWIPFLGLMVSFTGAISGKYRKVSDACSSPADGARNNMPGWDCCTA